ncbi:MAG: hypothetical protein H6R06_3015 [Proteobacteria bacterium]|nr:hypothetical protein [Pseudomonadota bacterium]
MTHPPRNDVPRITLAVLFIGALIVASFGVLRPVLIKRGADLPLLLIFAGVVGGLLSFGLVGLFVGPVVLAVAYTLLEDWTHAGPSPDTLAPREGAAQAAQHERVLP